jgi:hypothetical protein
MIAGIGCVVSSAITLVVRTFFLKLTHLVLIHFLNLDFLPEVC